MEGVLDVHTKVQGFGLALLGTNLSWPQLLKTSVLYDFDALIRNFIDAYSKIGINTVTKILNWVGA